MQLRIIAITISESTHAYEGMIMNILITGGTGFIGSALIKSLI